MNPCLQTQACGMNAECHIQTHYKQCTCPAGFTGNPEVECVRIPVVCNSDVECREGYNCHDSMCQPTCHSDQDCALNEKCLRGSCMRKYTGHSEMQLNPFKSNNNHKSTHLSIYSNLSRG